MATNTLKSDSEMNIGTKPKSCKLLVSNRNVIGSKKLSSDRCGDKQLLSPTTRRFRSMSAYLPSSGTKGTDCKFSPRSDCGPSYKGLPFSFSSAKKSRITYSKIQNAKSVVEKAVKENKVFTVLGPYPYIRTALWARGWVEKFFDAEDRPKEHPIKVAFSVDRECDDDGNVITDGAINMVSLVSNENLNEDTETSLITRLLRNHSPNFIWTVRRDTIEWRYLAKDQMVNRFSKAWFTTKVGLCANLQQLHWFSEGGGSSDNFFPRCYRICLDDEKAAFIEDFQLTACVNLLKWVVENYEAKGSSGIESADGQVPVRVVDFAGARCYGYIRSREHEDIDTSPIVKVWDHEWDEFLCKYYSLVHTGEKLVIGESEDTKVVYEHSKKALDSIAPYWPQLKMDGITNVWIVKPGAKSRGRGIMIFDHLEDILALVHSSIMKETRYVVQKYIERPLLIYNTKFDIRQWFLVTDWNPLTVWMYRESYLRFCSQIFSLEDRHEAIHLCNNAIQAKYINCERHESLPEENMWDCHTFIEYLRSIGKEEVWEEVIYPDMTQGITGALLASQDTMDCPRNCFELYGADFMLTEDYKPWLIEINACPCMSPSTSVTARMCMQCLEDVIKVVIDRREFKKCSTGGFEMVYKQHAVPTPQYMGIDLSVHGQKIKGTSMSEPAHRLKSGLKLKECNNSLKDETCGIEDTDRIRGSVVCSHSKSPRFTRLVHQSKEEMHSRKVSGVRVNGTKCAISVKTVKQSVKQVKQAEMWGSIGEIKKLGKTCIVGETKPNELTAVEENVIIENNYTDVSKNENHTVIKSQQSGNVKTIQYSEYGKNNNVGTWTENKENEIASEVVVAEEVILGIEKKRSQHLSSKMTPLTSVNLSSHGSDCCPSPGCKPFAEKSSFKNEGQEDKFKKPKDVFTRLSSGNQCDKMLRNLKLGTPIQHKVGRSPLPLFSSRTKLLVSNKKKDLSQCSDMNVISRLKSTSEKSLKVEPVDGNFHTAGENYICHNGLPNAALLKNPRIQFQNRQGVHSTLTDDKKYLCNGVISMMNSHTWRLKKQKAVEMALDTMINQNKIKQKMNTLGSDAVKGRQHVSTGCTNGIR